MYILDGKQLRIGKAFTGTDGTQYPANWLQLSSEAERTAIGISEVDDPARYNSGFYHGFDSDGNLIPRVLVDTPATDADNNPVLDNDGNQLTNIGLQTVYKEEQNRSAYLLLSSTDWYVVRKSETEEAIPVGITSFRTGVRSVCAERQAMISATVDVGQLESLMTGAGTSSIVGYSTTLLPEWPNLNDYT